MNARIETPFLVFKNDRSPYPIRVVSDSVPGVCYRSQPKSWVDRRVFGGRLSEPRAISALLTGEKDFCMLIIAQDTI